MRIQNLDIVSQKVERNECSRTLNKGDITFTPTGNEQKANPKYITLLGEASQNIKRDEEDKLRPIDLNKDINPKDIFDTFKSCMETRWNQAITILYVFLGAASGPLLALGLSCLGFGREGVRGGSGAARWQATYYGTIPEGSSFSLMQSAGATGVVFVLGYFIGIPAAVMGIYKLCFA